MPFEKSPPELVALFREALPDDPRLQQRQMFGYPAAFLDGRMLAGTFGEDIVLRLGDEDRASLLALPGAEPFEPMPGRSMREYVMVPRSMHDDLSALRAWLQRALAHAETLPPKAPGRTAKRRR